MVLPDLSGVLYFVAHPHSYLSRAECRVEKRMDGRRRRGAMEFGAGLARFLEVGLSRNGVFGKQTGFG
jgi:hypothetical protein